MTPTHDGPTTPPHGRPPVPPHTRITLEAAETLASLINLIRNDWHQPGIFKALERNAPYATALDITLATTHAARTPENKTPAILDYPGPHWDHTTQTDPNTPTSKPTPQP
ncbi:hypothetical protein, partial [Nesterenkonia rhizosphaerae]|uniref:hypothetical protein n=1 Tax=Nesterenkonia rhizosphaerae TaxID=1348272 RepID=UPI0031EC2651